MPYIPCRICRRKFYAKPSWLKRGEGKFCSIGCYTQARKTGKTINCFVCGKETYKPLKELNRSKYKRFFCSKKCSTPWRNSLYTGKRHPNWKYGEFSYKDTMNRNGAPQVCTLCATRNKEVIIVHHIDKNRKNNNISNLTWLCRNCHFLVHHYDDENKKLLKKV